MIDPPLVSIVIPCYRQAHFLPRAVQSCLDQSHTPLEIIVVDDGSPDDVAGALASFAGAASLIHQENLGLSAARNTGIAAARGDFLKFLDADDWLLPNCIADQVRALVGLTRHVAAIGYRFEFRDSPRRAETVYPAFGALRSALCYANIGPPQTLLFPSQALAEAGGFDTSGIVEGGHEDYDLLCRLAVRGYEVVALHTVGAAYRQVGASMSKQHGPMRTTRRAVWRRYIRALLATGTDPDLLVHIVGGFALRLRWGDFRFDGLPLLETISKRIRQRGRELSQAARIALAHHSARTLRYLPRPTDRREKIAYQRHLAMMEQLLDPILTDLAPESVERTDPEMETVPLRALMRLARALQLSGRGDLSRRVLASAAELTGNDRLLWAGVTAYSLFSRLPPSFLAPAVAAGLEEIYENYFLYR